MRQQYPISDYNLHKLLKRCRDLESRGYECVRRIQKEGYKWACVYAKAN